MGLIVRRECWTLSLSGKLLALAFAAALGTISIYGAYPFLAVNDPVRGDFIVLEGWATHYPGMLERAASEFDRGHYHDVLIVGSYRSDTVYGERCKSGDKDTEILEKFGVPCEAVTAVAAPDAQRDRTYHIAAAARDWFIRNRLFPKSFDVVTIGPHARRSRLTFQQVFGNTAKVGVIAASDPSYDPKHWWNTSEGFREVQGEAVAYIYAHRYLLWQ